MTETAKKILELLSPQEKLRLYFLFLMLFLMACVEMAGVASILPFMAVVSSPELIQGNRWLRQGYLFFGLNDPREYMFLLGMVVLGLLVFSNMFKALYTWLNLRFDNQLNYHLARRLLASYLARPYEFFLNRNSSELGKNVLAEVRGVITGVIIPFLQVLSSGLLCLLIMSLLMAVDPLIAMIIAAVLGGAYGVIYLSARRRLMSIGVEQVKTNTMKFKTATQALSGIKDLKVMAREPVFLERFAVHARLHARHNVTIGIISQLPRYALETIGFGGILLIVLCSLRSERDIARIVPLLSVYAFAGYRLLPALQQLFAGFSAVRVGLPVLEVLHRDLTAKGRGSASLAVSGCAGSGPLPFTRELALTDVTFCYDGSLQPAVSGISLSVTPATSIGIVGPTGSGKTTAIDMILGLLAPATGTIKADGIDISGDNLPRWQMNLGYVPQNIYLCDDTITSNIAFGVPECEIDMGAVHRAARIANLEDFITRELPQGYDTIIGERGVRLSGGQRQRIGIARALYRDPPVLIMDEATSALDGITEEAVMEALRNVAGKKTVIMIAHRLTTVKDCTVIYLMDKGRIVGRGTYDELMGSSSWFRAATRTGTG